MLIDDSAITGGKDPSLAKHFEGLCGAYAAVIIHGKPTCSQPLRSSTAGTEQAWFTTVVVLRGSWIVCKQLNPGVDQGALKGC